MALKEYFKLKMASVGLAILSMVLILASFWIGFISLIYGQMIFTILAVVMFIVALIILIPAKYYATKAKRSIPHKIEEE